MNKGFVKWFNNKKGYGFITDESGEDVFVHYSNIEGEGYKTLKEKDPVTFDVIESDKGKQATNIQLA